MDFDSRLLVKYLIEELSSEELRKLMDWKNDSEENEKIFNLLIELRISQRFLTYNTPDKIENALHKMQQQINPKKPIYRLISLLKYAAIFILLATLSYGGWTYLNQPESYLSIQVSDGEGIKKIPLDDGSVVWLNRGTLLRIPDSFSASNRRVQVDGEAFFEVKKNPEYPFWVDAGMLNIKVLGTSFNLNTRTNGKQIETVLVSGKVNLEDKNHRFLIEMSPGEKVSFTPEKNEFIVEKVDTNIYTAWHLDQLKFENVTLREIADILSTLYEVNINLAPGELAHKKFRYVINRDEKLPEALNLLKHMAPIDYEIEGKEVFIYEQQLKKRAH